MSAGTCKRCDGRGTEPSGLQCNDGTEACPTCLSAASSSTLRATADIRAKLAAAEARVAVLGDLMNEFYEAMGCSLCSDRLPCERHPRVMERQ